MKLTVKTKQIRPGIVTVIPQGPLDGETYMLLGQTVSRTLEEPLKVLVLDMEGVDFITSAGVGAIMKIKTSLAKRGMDMAMTNLQPQVEKVFQIIRVLPTLGVFRNRQELDEYLGTIQHRMMGEQG